MRNLITLLLLVISINFYAQDKIVVEINNNEIFIETYKKTDYNFNFKTKENIWSGKYLFVKAYRLGPSAASELKKGIRTAIKWIDLNEIHKKSFEKEVFRFKAIEKEFYKSYGYTESLAKEMTLLFNGYSDGSFKLRIKGYDSSSNFLEFKNMDMVESFKELLDGKSANSEIDDIFKH